MGRSAPSVCTYSEHQPTTAKLETIKCPLTHVIPHEFAFIRVTKSRERLVYVYLAARDG